VVSTDQSCSFSHCLLTALSWLLVVLFFPMSMFWCLMVG
jgi:hypothetical protein